MRGISRLKVIFQLESGQNQKLGDGLICFGKLFPKFKDLSQIEIHLKLCDIPRFEGRCGHRWGW